MVSVSSECQEAIPPTATACRIPGSMKAMSSKTRPSRTLTEEEMIERIREAQQEGLDGKLVRCTNEAEVRAYFASVRNSEA